ncbi:MAG: O-antigen ligase family protein [Formivibrio sp.]|nr:O-antigen ligase family protein [Formivibrio sp.]
MGFVLSVLYIVTYYFTPTVLFGPLAAYHVELILAALVLLVSLPRLIGSFTLRSPQSLALIGLALAVFLSVLIGMRWAGGAVIAFLGFIPCAYGYFIVCLHCNTKKKLQILILLMLFVCLFVITNGCLDQLRGIPQSGQVRPGDTEGIDPSTWDAVHPYLFAMRSEAGEWFFRLRGLGLINDPNDFGQLLVCTIPLIFIFWRPKKVIFNAACVAFPVCVLLLGVFLTHSRGALLALIVVAVLAVRRRIGMIPALLVAGGLFAAAMAMHFTGGRGVSASAGEDRTALWGQSLQLLKSHPLFGVGFGNLPDYLGLTAHNSVAVCAAELGLFGLFFWCLFLFSTFRDALWIASPKRVSEGEVIVAEAELFPQPTKTIETIDIAEINHLGRLVVLSLTGFLVAGWFLSRAFVMTLFLLGGMTEVVYEMALQRGMVGPRLRLARLLPYAGILAVSLVFVLYVMIRILNLMH